jgi:hypothetical protein
MNDRIEITDPVADSPVGPGAVTGFTQRGYPQVNHVAVTWLRLTDGATFDPHEHVGGSKHAARMTATPTAPQTKEG